MLEIPKKGFCETVLYAPTSSARSTPCPVHHAAVVDMELAGT